MVSGRLGGLCDERHLIYWLEPDAVIAWVGLAVIVSGLKDVTWNPVRESGANLAITYLSIKVLAPGTLDEVDHRTGPP
jgi:hypothetical protein